MGVPQKPRKGAERLIMKVKLKIEREIDLEPSHGGEWSIGDVVDELLHDSEEGETVHGLAFDLTPEEIISNRKIVENRIKRGDR